MKTWKLFNKENVIDNKAYNFAQKVMKGKTVVIADDNGGIIKWLKFSLEDYGALVDIFEHGKETIDFVTQKVTSGKSVDILILDLIMNEIGGIEIAQRVKAVTPSSIIIFITGCSKESEEWREASKNGIIIQKPVGIESILSAVINNMEEKTASRNSSDN
jgi:DNA-binding NtrC family response regulator